MTKGVSRFGPAVRISVRFPFGSSLSSKLVVYGHSLCDFALHKVLSIKTAPIAVHLNAGVVLVVTV